MSTSISTRVKALDADGLCDTSADVIAKSGESEPERFKTLQSLLNQMKLAPQVQSLAEDYHDVPKVALTIAYSAPEDVLLKLGDEALTFLETHKLPESMTIWVVELLLLRSVSDALGQGLRSPRRASRSIIVSDPSDTLSVTFIPPPVAEPEVLERTIKDFFKAAESDALEKYLGLRGRDLQQQVNSVRRYVDWLYRVHVERLNARDVAEQDRKGSDRQTSTSDVNRGIKSALAYLDGKRP